MNNFRWAIRSLLKQPGFTTLALVTLALGIGSATVAFTVLDTVLLRPLPYHDSGRLVLIRERTTKGDLRPPSYPNFSDWRDHTRSFTGVASEMYPESQTVSVGGTPLWVSVAGVSRDFFATLGVAPLVGREFIGAENKPGGPQTVMVSYDFWKTHMGGRTPLGTVDFGTTPATVIGVLPPDFRFIQPQDIYFPHEQEPATVRSGHNYRVIARLAPGVTLGAARADMTTLSRALFAEYGTETEAADADVTPLRDYLVGNYRVMLTLVFGAAALVLLIACTNLVSAQLARGFGREREIAVRAALGASHGQLVRQLFAESSVLVLSGAMVGTLFAVLLTRVVKLLGTGLVPRLEELAVDGRVLAFSVAITMTAGLLVGLYPALRLSGSDPGTALRGGRGSDVTVRSAVWRLLIGFEMAMAVVLLIGSTLLVRTLHNILTADTGFDARGVVTAQLVPDSAPLARLEQLRAELAALPGASGAAYTTRLPLDWGMWAGPVRRPSDPLDRDWPAMAGFRVVSPEYFAVLRQPVLRGRAFTSADRDGSAKVAIITTGIANALWPGQDPLGKIISSNFLFDQKLTVVGVVAEASSWTMPRGSQNEIYTPLAQQPAQAQSQLVAIVRTTGDPHALIPAIRARLHALAPEMPAQLGTMEDRIDASAADRRFAMVALTLFGAIALVLAGIGIYGVISYTVATHAREIGIRMALGATPGMVQSHVLRDAASLAAGGIGAGVVLGLFATRYLEATLYGVTRLDPLAYGVGACVLLLAALLGAYVPARRSSRVDPLLAIRGE